MTNSVLSPTEPTDENNIHPKMPWNSMSANVGFVSRPKGQPLSPTKYGLNQGSDPFRPPNSMAERSTLLDGSHPDIEDGSNDIQESFSRTHRSLTSSARPILSPTRATNHEQRPFEHQALNNSSIKHIGNDPFGSGQRFENGHHHPANDNTMANGTGMVAGIGNIFQSARPGYPHHSSNIPNSYQALSPPFPTSNGRVLPTTQRPDSYSPSTHEFTESPPSLVPTSFNQAQDHTGSVPARRSSMYQQPYRDSNGAELRALVQPSIQFPGMESTFQTTQGHLNKANTSRLDPLATPHHAGMPYGGRGALSPMANEYRSNFHSPYYSAAATPPTGPESIRSTPASGASSRTSHNDQMLLDQKLRNLEVYHYDQNPSTMTSLQQQLHHVHQYDLSGHGLAVRLNPQAHPYGGLNYPQLSNYPAAPRFQGREPDHQAVRSPILEDFRMNSKTNKRLELKDIYNHVVEFSGDQHGSRFIQQKLETANSDEKEQVFKEIQPNLLQLMTDVFGNYVIQKMFEHGNQSQKKVLANQMKGHVWTLSMQMYGCRVVQKAFEYVLTDQQASLVKELDGPNSQILKIVRDQNGNHVVQKAIERIPGEHIQFIVDAHRGQMMKMSTHQYGCRVVQRMLEHCQPKVKRVILDELLQNIQPLILDSYGNYVVQHIIQSGEPQDRRFVVNIVIKQLLVFSKHKFASNIVEKSIDFADQDQRIEILRQLTTPDEMGSTPVLGLMRDQFGNYVLQKVHAQLVGAELVGLEADMKQNYPLLKRTSYGKQVGAIEKLLFGGNGRSTASTSSHGSELPSTTNSSTTDSPDTPTRPSEGK
ncbi:uncharacterized protein A1O9_02747 [Exophiala aquamarina CBS 119918]|uniref:Pumilio homology domain family member 3 n=1 Tax=Exophiala aquamarina CBS 119918 TaxID=1182545 RepID=A0A072PN52_9EURO|nr:uncharacterized protein A1O9_02747 [Exophiala aquamarina CBS 119918]KEF61182.1 hypothetical protein A1O9_02747 [Exophiala aquamarina CBS 119918]